MIYGVGSDIVEIDRLRRLWQKHGDHALGKLLADTERVACQQSKDPGRFLAKRFAAKEALGKALGIGIRAPLQLNRIAVIHNEMGKPMFGYAEEISDWMRQRGLLAHLSISDEASHALAFVVVEQS